MNRPTYLEQYETSTAFTFGGRLVCGTSGLGGVWGKIDPGESIEAILYALENGVQCFDTAPSYADAEQYLGEALKQWEGPQPFVSTKIGRHRGETAFDFKLDYSYSALKKSLSQSLERLGREKINLIFLHEPQCVPEHELERIISNLLEFKSEGLIDYIGVGGNPPEYFFPVMAGGVFDVVSGFLKLDACNLSALQRDIPWLRENHMAYYAASPLHFSLLAGGLERYIESGPDGDWVTIEDIRHATAVKQLAMQNGISFSSLCQRYVFSIAEADRVVVGARTLKQMRDTLNDWRQGPLPQSLFDAITDIILTTP
jgi:aryl-alcohol dehydrogenase-like predicted oxidoreductase